MQIKKQVYRQEQKSIPVRMYCNFCGKELVPMPAFSNSKYVDNNGNEVEEYYFNYASVEFHFGYGSKLDGVEGEIHFCEDCIEELNSILKIPARLTWMGRVISLDKDCSECALMDTCEKKDEYQELINSRHFVECNDFQYNGGNS